MLNCFVREGAIDNDFKMAMYPRWQEASFMVTSEVCKTKELYYKIVNEPRIKQKTDDNPLDLIKLHHDLAEITDKLSSEIKEVCQKYTDGVKKVFAQFGASLDSTGRIAAKIERCFVPYVNEAEAKRRDVFETFQKNLVDGLLWEHTTRANRRLETQGQPSVGNGNSTTDANPRVVPAASRFELKWDEYQISSFASSKSAVVQPASAKNEEEDDQVRSVN